MTGSGALPPAFRGRRLVVFDLDGTLYRQGPLRRRMAARLALDALRRRDAGTLRILRDYRRRKEALADAGAAPFDGPLVAGCAEACGVGPEAVRAAVGDWIERRPLPLLARCEVPGARALVERLREAGVRVGVWSDYPARDKLAAMGIAVDAVVSAADDDLAVMKPDPRGLLMLMARAGVRPDETLMVGDRDERDGRAARAAGVDFLRRSDRARPGEPGAVRDFAPAALETARPAAAAAA